VSVIDRFYRAFAERDADGMCACYHPAVHFSDPVFPDLQGPRAGAMWQMLCASGEDLRIEYERLDEKSARWNAWYTFQGGRAVHNLVDASFELEDGLITRHTDRFDLWRWSRMALGPTGYLLGWTPMVRSAIRRQANKGLDHWIETKGLPELNR